MRYNTAIQRKARTALSIQLPIVMFLALVAIVGCCTPGHAATPPPFSDTKITRLAILQPESASNHRSAYYQVVNSVVNHPDIDASVFNLSKYSNKETVEQWLNKQSVHAVLTLGRDSHDIVRQLTLKTPIIAGGLALNPNGISGISLCAQPEIFFAQLHTLTPRIKRVSIVYSESVNGWWVTKAKAQAAAFDLELVAYQASSIREAVMHYETLIAQARPEQDAIWIPLVDIVPAKTILPMVLKAAWDKRLVVFSNNPVHARQGALFSLYPNNESMGKQLAELSITLARNPEHREVKMASDLKIAFNQRTGAHLGIEISSQMLERFDRVYPTH